VGIGTEERREGNGFLQETTHRIEKIYVIGRWYKEKRKY
jgi:hypothetical protein